MVHETEIKQVLWRCRRGSRELELILREFVSKNYDDLSEFEKKAFDELLEFEDPELTDWLCLGISPVAQQYGQGMVNIVSRILSAYNA